MEALLYICHGSRVKKAQDEAIAFIKKCMENSQAPIKEYCFLELASPSIEEAYISCINQGADTITAIPVLLLTAAHAKIDIPGKLRELALKFPEVPIKYANPVGVHEKMIDILVERMEESGERADKDSLVLLVGRGSSDSDVKADLGAIADMLKNRTGVKKVEICFLAAATPSLEEGIKITSGEECSKVFVIPYLLFTGILMKQIQKIIQKQGESRKFILCHYLGYHPNIESVLQERVKGASMLGA